MHKTIQNSPRSSPKSAKYKHGSRTQTKSTNGEANQRILASLAARLCPSGQNQPSPSEYQHQVNGSGCLADVCRVSCVALFLDPPYWRLQTGDRANTGREVGAYCEY